MTDPGGQPVDSATFAQLMAPFEPFEARPVLAVAVSGGRDSLALALLGRDWAAARDGGVVGLIVDHGLRTGSAAEAAAATELLQTQGIEATVLCWSGAKPASALQQRAREARYDLLRTACRKRGILHLLVGHHADDQAETMAMRAARLSGPDGLAGMAPLVEFPEARLLRPLLALPRSRLTATLAARHIAWIDDPSNFDLRFERARLRRTGIAGPIVAAGTKAAGERAVHEGRLAQAAVGVLEFDQEGAAAIDHAGFLALTSDLQRRLLGRIVQAIGGRDHPTRRDRLDRARRRLCSSPARGRSGRGGDFTLSGCRLALRQVAAGHRLRWIVRPESGRKGGQPLIPAAFFACSGTTPPHLD